MDRFFSKAVLLRVVGSATFLAAASTGLAQVSSINSAVIDQRAFNDVPGATGTFINSYPTSITLGEANVSQPTGFANREIWYFSNNGTSAYSFQNGDYFNASFTLNLTGTDPNNRDLEAGFIFSNPSGSFGGDCQLVVEQNGAVVQFGGPSSYPFSPAANGFPGPGATTANYPLATPITMGFNYVIDPNTGHSAFQYSINGLFAASAPGDPYFDFNGTIAGAQAATLGGYIQVGDDPNFAGMSGQAVFSNFSIIPAPEPASMGLFLFGIPALLARRSRKS